MFVVHSWLFYMSPWLFSCILYLVELPILEPIERLARTRKKNFSSPSTVSSLCKHMFQLCVPDNTVKQTEQKHSAELESHNIYSSRIYHLNWAKTFPNSLYRLCIKVFRVHSIWNCTIKMTKNDHNIQHIIFGFERKMIDSVCHLAIANMQRICMCVSLCLKVWRARLCYRAFHVFQYAVISYFHCFAVRKALSIMNFYYLCLCSTNNFNNSNGPEYLCHFCIEVTIGISNGNTKKVGGGVINMRSTDINAFRLKKPFHV